MRLQNQEFDNLNAVCHEHEIDQLNGMFQIGRISQPSASG
jgi:peptide deformylase